MGSLGGGACAFRFAPATKTIWSLSLQIRVAKTEAASASRSPNVGA
jgi:hypothetical protein